MPQRSARRGMYDTSSSRAHFDGPVAKPRVHRSGAHVAYSPYLLSGLLRCGCCGARMVAQTTTRKKGTDIYRYGGLPVRIRQDEGADGLYGRDKVPPGAA